MVTLDIDGKKYDVPTDWKDITLEYWCGWYAIILKHQEMHKSRLKEGEFDENKPLEKITSTEMLSLNKEIFQYITKIDDETLKRCDLDSISAAMEFIAKVTEEYKPKGLKSFIFEEEEYFFPQEAMYDNTFGDYIEATQLDMTIEHMKHGSFDVLPEQMAILCRKIGEKYDDKEIPKKTERFKKLTMDIVWEFSFFLSIQNLKLRNHFQMFTGGTKVEQVV
tara:strand:- start:1479 stop:2141 length:663 start_codon:yes stop_codon:yes gene_type:complete